MTETQLKLKVLKKLKSLYPDAWIYKTSDNFTSGIPDILMLNGGKFYAIELKVGKNKATRLQAFVLRKIRSAGGVVGVCYSVDEALQVSEGVGIFDNLRIQGG